MKRGRFVLTLLLLATLSATAQTKADKKDKKAVAPAPAAASVPTKATATSAILANKDSKTFHKADCKLTAKMKESNKTTFASAAEAIKAGYKACKVCKP